MTALCKGVGVPLLFELLDKKGNSNTDERTILLKKLIRILPVRQIASFTADREFVGEKWYNFLIIKKIPFYIRIKSNTLIEYRGVTFHAARFAVDKRKRFFENIRIHGFRLKLATKQIGHQEGSEDKYLLILTNANVKKAIAIYRNRWSIEVFFQSIKKRGFNLENTHLTDLSKLKKLFDPFDNDRLFCIRTKGNESIRNYTLIYLWHTFLGSCGSRPEIVSAIRSH